MRVHFPLTRLFLALGLAINGGIGCATSNKASDSLMDIEGSGQNIQLGPKERAEQAFNAAAKILHREEKNGQIDWVKAEERFVGLTQQFPRLGIAWYNLGVIRERLGRVKVAEAAYRKAISVGPKLSMARENLAGIVLRQGDKHQAISILRQVVAMDPSASTARLALGRSLLAAGRVDEAIELSQAALAADPKNLGGYCIQALAAVQSKEYQRVRLLNSQGLKIDKGPQSACLHHAMGLVLLAEGETANALLEFTEAVRKDPTSNFEAWFRIAEISMEFKNFKRAVESYQTVSDLDPTNLEAHLNLGVALKGLGNFIESESAYLKALQIAGDQDLPQAHFNLGVLYLRNLNKLKKATQRFKTYIKLVRPPQNASVFTWLKEIKQRQELEVEMRSSTEPASRK